MAIKIRYLGSIDGTYEAEFYDDGAGEIDWGDNLTDAEWVELDARNAYSLRRFPELYPDFYADLRNRAMDCAGKCSQVHEQITREWDEMRGIDATQPHD